MNLTLHLPPETEAKLQEQSALTGKSPECLALEALEEKLAESEETAQLPADQWRAQFKAWLATMPRGNPNADLSRESIYGDRGL